MNKKLIFKIIWAIKELIIYDQTKVFTHTWSEFVNMNIQTLTLVYMNVNSYRTIGWNIDWRIEIIGIFSLKKN